MLFGCDLFLNDLVWYYWGQVRSELVCFWCSLVFMLWFGVIFTFVGGHQCFCDLGVICFWMIWCDIIEVSLGLSWFVFGVVWCLMVWFGVIFTFFVSIGCFLVRGGCDLFLNDLVWYYWGQVRSELVLFWCGLMSYVVVWCD